MQTVLNGVVINSEELQGIAKEFGKAADRKSLRDNNVYLREILDEADNTKKQGFYIVSEGFSLQKVIDTNQETITTAVPISEFRTNIAALPNKEDITLSLKKSLSLTWGEKGSELLVGTNNEQVALLEIPEIVDWIEWKPGTLHKIYRDSIGFTASSTGPIADSNPILTGVFFQRENYYKETYIRATDQRKAASLTEEIEWFDTSFSIPASTLSALVEVIPTDVNLRIGVNENGTLLVFKTSDTTVVTRVLNGVFPDIDRKYTLSPSDAETTYSIDLQQVMDACYMATKLSATNWTIQIRVHDNKVYCFTNLDEESKTFKLKYFLGGSVDGEPEPISVDASNLLAAAKLFDGDEISLLTPGKNKPVTVINEDTDLVQALIGQIKL